MTDMPGHRDPLIWVDLFAFSTFIIFFQLEAIAGIPSPGKLSLLPLILSLGKNMLLFPALSLPIHKQVIAGFGGIFFRFEALLLYAMLALWTVADFRALMNGVMPWSVFSSGLQRSLILVGAIAAFALAHPAPEYRRKALLAIMMAPSVYVAFNLLLWASGVRGLGEAGSLIMGGSNSIAGMVGLNIPRVKFPMTPGINTMGVVAGIAFATSVASVLVVSGLRHKLMLFLAASISIAAMVMVDSRGPLLACALFLLAWLAVRKMLFRWLAILVVLLPLVLVFGLWLASVLAAELALGVLTRTGSAAGIQAFEAVSTGRSAIWKAAVSRFEFFQWEILFGYGTYSQMVSGFGSDYSLELVRSLNRVPSFHNLYLQTIYDVGLLGLLMTIFFLWTISTRVSGSNIMVDREVNVMPAAALILMILIGATESIPTKYQPDSFWIFLGIVASVIFLLTPKTR